MFTYKKLTTFSIAFSLLAIAGSAMAITIDGGPTYTPPGFGSVASSGTGAAFAGGLTYSYTGLDLTQTANLYYGIRNDIAVSGFSMDGSSISGPEIFRFQSAAGNSIVYAGSTLMQFGDGQPDYNSPTRLTITLNGSGGIVNDATTQGLSNANGDVGALWQVLSDFTANYLVEATVPPFDPAAGQLEPGNDLFNRLQTINTTGTSFDEAFYYEIPEPSSLALCWIVCGGFAAGRRLKWV